MRNIDLPPIWLLGFILAVWVGAQVLPGWVAQSVELDGMGRGFVLIGIGLTVFALVSFRRAKTTPIPHKRASALITTGLYERSRNPIYLADVCILIGAILWIGLWPALVLVPVFIWILTVRFIRPEEARLREDFGATFEDWCRRTRRWM